MIVKYIDPNTNWITVQNVQKAIMKKVDKKEKDIPVSFVVEFLDGQFCDIVDVYVKSYEKGAELIDRLYQCEKLDLSTLPDVFLIVESVSAWDVLGELNLDDLDLDLGEGLEF